MSGYRLLNYAGPAGEACPGIAVGEDLIDLKAAGVQAQLLSYSKTGTIAMNG